MHRQLWQGCAGALPLLLAAAVAVLPLLWAGPSCGHDFDFHLLSWLEAGQQLAHGGWPRWAFTPAWNAGEPRFLFYPPLSWLLGGLLGRVLPWAWVPAVYTWAALAAAGLLMRAWLSRLVAPGSATLAATLYLANPYMLFTAYERTAYAELLAAAWLPLLLAGVFAAAQGTGSLRRRMAGLAVPVGLLWVTNAPAAVMGCYTVLLLLGLALVRRGGDGGRPARRILLAVGSGGVLLGLALAGVYLVPALAERHRVATAMAVTEGMRPLDHTLFHRMAVSAELSADDAAFHDSVVRSASWIALGLGAASLLLFAFARRRLRNMEQPHATWIAGSLAALTGVVLLLQTPASLPVWTHLPELAYLQFPWRLTALLGAAAAVLGALAMPGLRTRAGCSAPLLALLLSLPAWGGFHQACDADDSVAGRVALFHSAAGTEPTDEYTPLDADPEALARNDPGWWLAPPSQPDAQPSARQDANGLPAPLPPNTQPGQAPSRLSLTLAGPQVLVLNRRAYPLWQVRVNGPAASPLPRTDGLIAVPLPAGADTVELSAVREWDAVAGPLLSLLALAVLLSLLLPGTRRASTSAPYPGIS